KVIPLLLAAVVIFSTPITAQIGRALKEKASKAIGNMGKKAVKEAEEEADSLAQQKAEEEVNKQTEKALEQREEKGINLGGLFGGKVDLKYEEAYTFGNMMYMQAEIYSEKDVVKMDYYIYYNDDNQNGCVETQAAVSTSEGAAPMKTSIIFDAVNKCMILLTDIGATRMGMISAVPDETPEEKAGEPAEKPEMGQLTKTGNSRVIAGYRCDEYIYREQGEKDYGKLWITRDFKLNTDRRTMSKSGMPSYYSELPEGGAVLAMESYDENNKLTMKSETKEIKTNISHATTVKGYPLRQINFNQMQNQPGKK
ncbi:MAG: hypothetical protein ACUVTX_10100, partial [Bacteroidales bacterium]